MKDFRWDGKSRNWDCAIFVYRDPFSRAVSTFSNKFIQKSGNHDIFNNFEKLTGKKANTATFREFVKYMELPFGDLDPHVWPQKSHLLNIDYTHAIDIKNLNEVIAKNFPSISKYFEKKVNRSALIVENTAGQDFSDTPANEVGAHSLNNFEAMRESVERRYFQDLEMVKGLSKKNNHLSP